MREGMYGEGGAKPGALGAGGGEMRIVSWGVGERWKDVRTAAVGACLGNTGCRLPFGEA